MPDGGADMSGPERCVHHVWQDEFGFYGGGWTTSPCFLVIQW